MTSVTFAATLLATYLLQSFAFCALGLGGARLVSRPRDRDMIWKLALVAPILIAPLDKVRKVIHRTRETAVRVHTRGKAAGGNKPVHEAGHALQQSRRNARL